MSTHTHAHTLLYQSRGVVQDVFKVSVQSIKSHVSLYVADKTEECLPSVGFFTDSVSVLSPPLPSGDRFFYFLHSHHLTAFLDSTLLILGIASLLASVVVLCYRPKLVWNSFISELLFLLFFFVISLIPSRLVPALFFDDGEAQRCRGFHVKQINADVAYFVFFFFYIYLDQIINPGPEILQTRSLLNRVGLSLSGKTDSGCNYQENWALFL